MRLVHVSWYLVYVQIQMGPDVAADPVAPGALPGARVIRCEGAKEGSIWEYVVPINPWQINQFQALGVSIKKNQEPGR